MLQEPQNSLSWWTIAICQSVVPFRDGTAFLPSVSQLKIKSQSNISAARTESSEKDWRNLHKACICSFLGSWGCHTPAVAHEHSCTNGSTLHIQCEQKKKRPPLCSTELVTDSPGAGEHRPSCCLRNSPIPPSFPSVLPCSKVGLLYLQSPFLNLLHIH